MFTWMLASFGVGAFSFLASSFLKKKSDDLTKEKNEVPTQTITSDCFNRIYRDETKKKSEVNKDDFLVLKNGTNRIKVLPPSGGEDAFISRKQHYINNSAYQCGTSSGTRCPICEFRKTYNSAKLIPTRRFYFNVLHQGKVKLLSTSETLAKKLNSHLIESKNSYDDYDIEINVGKNTHGYSVYDVNFIKNPQKSTNLKTFDLNEVAKQWNKSEIELSDALDEFLKKQADFE